MYLAHHELEQRSYLYDYYYSMACQDHDIGWRHRPMM